MPLVKKFGNLPVAFEKDTTRVLPYLNLNHETWLNPETGEAFNESFDELFKKANADTLEVIDDVNAFLFQDKPLSNHFILDNLSYNTGLNCELGQTYKYAKKYPVMEAIKKSCDEMDKKLKSSFREDVIRSIVVGSPIAAMYIASMFDNKFDIGSLITYTSMVIYFLEPIRNIIDLDFSFKESRESISRVIGLYENYSDKGVINFKNGLIDFKNLSFTFDNKKDVLSNINLVINKGEKILFYGPSGSGKSTLLKLLMHYYDVPRGCIFISGNDINDYRTSSLRKNISYISQNEILFNDSLFNNLKFYGNDVVSISKCFKFNEIMDNNLGFNMMIEENGFNLSGGQRQRIVLARTFMKQAPIILIDEGLSQIDDSLEREILTNVFDRYDSTIIIVSHRLSNTDLYDRIIHFKEGEIVDETV